MLSAIINADVFDGERIFRDHSVLVRDGRVEELISGNTVPAECKSVVDNGGRLLVPGFIDLQVNGGGGVLFNDAPTVQTLETISSAHRRFGTTGLLPTIISDDLSVMIEAIQAVEQAISEGVPGILGIHLEGPYLNVEKRGIHDAMKIRQIDSEGVRIATLLKSGKTLLTIAPELVESVTIEALVEAGVIVAAGHSAASYEESILALKAGLTGFTHLFNAMTPFKSREPGMVGAAIEDAASWFGIIADGHHVHPASLGIAIAAKKCGGAILVTDAMPSVGSKRKVFELGGERISAVNGVCTNEDGVLAGSDLDMISAVNNTSRFAKIDWLEAVRMATLYPATALGLEDQYGLIRPGYFASLVAVDASRNVVGSWIHGNYTEFQ